MRKLITMLVLLSFLGLNLSSCDTEDFKSNKELFDIEDIKNLKKN